MKTWEEAEFEMQQEAYKKWAYKKYMRMIKGWWFNRKLDKIRNLAEIITGKSNLIAYIGFEELGGKAEECKKFKI